MPRYSRNAVGLFKICQGSARMSRARMDGATVYYTCWVLLLHPCIRTHDHGNGIQNGNGNSMGLGQESINRGNLNGNENEKQPAWEWELLLVELIPTDYCTVVLSQRKQRYNSFAANISLLLLYVLAAWPMNKSGLKSLDFAVDSFLCIFCIFLCRLFIFCSFVLLPYCEQRFS